jgi:choline-sulfatase
MLREGPWKYIVTHGLPPLLFNLQTDTDELENLAGRPEHAATVSRLHARLVQGWDPAQVHARILASQRRRLFLRELALASGAFPEWNYEARAGDARRFVRPATATGAVGAKPRARFPYVDPTPPDRTAT